MNVNFHESYNVSEKYKSLVWLPERTGSRTSAKFLTNYGFERGEVPLINGKWWVYTHYCGMNERFNDYILISTARNPYSRVLSIYLSLTGFPPEYKGNTKETFREYLKWVQKQDYDDLTKAYITNPRLKVRPNYLLKLENLLEDYMKLPFILDVFTFDEITEKLKHKKPPYDWEPYYDEHMKNIVYDLCAHHFEIWGYEK